ncbi:hypothetical protein J7T55_002935 [Diaporthe amygdali]|uniref:uncharacterized protein n=1 Tax=Phomopsis amygdali TaxID=1214568 RepID=UPI0022FEAF7C|nr:uncharacterized protein J7T55_002935 [Diaporthe amygdali]KAJ0122422.1 hypothetical protein J7T55_002935 [Diaporthe amygdali]
MGPTATPALSPFVPKLSLVTAKTKRGGQPHAWYLGIGTQVAGHSHSACEGAVLDGAAASPNRDLTDDNDKEAEARQ